MNLAGIESALYSRLSFAAAPDSAVVSRLRAYINEAYREILGKRSLSRLRRSLLTFSCTANSPFVVLPQAATRVISIQDRVNNWELVEVPFTSIRQGDPGLTSSSAFPDRYAIYNLSAGVALDPDDAGGTHLYVASDSAGDTNAKTAYVEGVTAGGYYRLASVALNGVTRAEFSPALTDWKRVTKFYIALTAGGAATATGNLSLYERSAVPPSGQDELSRITPGRSFARYTRLHLYPTPTAANTYYTDVELHVEDLANAGDEPLLPEEYHWLLTCGSLMKEYNRRQWPIQFSEEKTRWNDGIGDLVVNLVRLTSGTPPQPRRFSQLGPYFPPGS